MNILQFIERLDTARETSAGWIALCPAHDDTNPSLSIAESDDGRILVHCHAGCRPEDIVAALGLTMANLFPRPVSPASSTARTKALGCIVTSYSYTDAAGRLLFQVCRMDPKDFRQRRPDGKGGWIWNTKDVRHVLYRLPDVIEAVQAGETVFIVEGEKDVDVLSALGLTATTNAGGAGKWRAEYNSTLRGAEVVIVPDHDAPGRKHATDLARHLHGVAASVRILELPNLPDKGDVSDWIATGGTREQLEALAASAPLWERQEDGGD
jgi:putative DNA primase/helicase